MPSHGVWSGSQTSWLVSRKVQVLMLVIWIILQKLYWLCRSPRHCQKVSNSVSSVLLGRPSVTTFSSESLPFFHLVESRKLAFGDVGYAVTGLSVTACHARHKCALHRCGKNLKNSFQKLGRPNLKFLLHIPGYRASLDEFLLQIKHLWLDKLNKIYIMLFNCPVTLLLVVVAENPS